MSIRLFYSGAICALAGLSACVSKKSFETQSLQVNSLKTALDKEIAGSAILQRRLDSMSLVMERDKKAERNAEVMHVYNSYKKARSIADYPTAVVHLSSLLELDSTQAYWIYDSLAFYHYLYLNAPGGTYIPKAALNYADKGLALNPDNEFLMDIRAKMLLLYQNSAEPVRIYEYLWNKTKDYTYYWNIAYIQLIAFQDVKKAENIISDVLKTENLATKKVRIANLDERQIDNVSAKAAFLFLRGVIQVNMGQVPKAQKTFEEVVKIAPEYGMAQRYLQEVRAAAQGRR